MPQVPAQRLQKAPQLLLQLLSSRFKKKTKQNNFCTSQIPGSAVHTRESANTIERLTVLNHSSGVFCKAHLFSMALDIPRCAPLPTQVPPHPTVSQLSASQFGLVFSSPHFWLFLFTQFSFKQRGLQVPTLISKPLYHSLDQTDNWHKRLKW